MCQLMATQFAANTIVREKVNGTLEQLFMTPVTAGELILGKLTPYLLLLPSAVAIGLLLVWPTIQIAGFSFQNYGLPQVTGAAPTTWTVGLSSSRATCSKRPRHRFRQCSPPRWCWCPR